MSYTVYVLLSYGFALCSLALLLVYSWIKLK